MARSTLMNPSDIALFVALGHVGSAFRALGVDYFVGGFVASTIFGEPRLTVDADIHLRAAPPGRTWWLAWAHHRGDNLFAQGRRSTRCADRACASAFRSLRVAHA
jgi:hypothetical protein